MNKLIHVARCGALLVPGGGAGPEARQEEGRTDVVHSDGGR